MAALIVKGSCGSGADEPVGFDCIIIETVGDRRWSTPVDDDEAAAAAAAADAPAHCESPSKQCSGLLLFGSVGVVGVDE